MEMEIRDGDSDAMVMAMVIEMMLQFCFVLQDDMSCPSSIPTLQ